MEEKVYFEIIHSSVTRVVDDDVYLSRFRRYAGRSRYCNGSISASSLRATWFPIVLALPHSEMPRWASKMTAAAFAALVLMGDRHQSESLGSVPWHV